MPLNNDNWQIAGCPVNGPTITAQGSHVAAAWFSAADQMPKVSLKLSADSGASFGEAISIATEGALGHVDTVMLPDNSVIVSWLQSHGAGLASLLIRRVTPDGEAGPVRTITTESPARSVPQIEIAGDGLVVVWTDISDGESRIRSGLINVDALPLPSD